MKITVTQTLHNDGGISFSVLGPHGGEDEKEVYTAYLGVPQQENYEWACAMAGVYVKGMLLELSPLIKTAKKKKASKP